MPDGVHINLNDLSPETVQTLVDGVVSLLSSFAAPDYDGSSTISPELAHELYIIAGILDADGASQWEQVCIEAGFHVGVFATVACVGTLIPEFRERLRERVRALKRPDMDPVPGDGASISNILAGEGRRIRTVYMPNCTDPKIHHPYEECPERQQIIQSGEYEGHNIFVSAAGKTTEARRIWDSSTGGRRRQDLKPCSDCLGRMVVNNWLRP